MENNFTITQGLQERIRELTQNVEVLSGLKNGWFEGDCLSPSKEGLDWIRNVMEKYLLNGLPLPYLYPMLDGGIQAEWTIKSYEITLEINLENHTGYCDFIDMNSHNEGTLYLDLERENDWLLLINTINSL